MKIPASDRGRRPRLAADTPRLPRLPRLAGLALVVFGIGGGAVRAAEERAPGSLCIAPFHVEVPAPGEPPNADPILSRTTWPPSAKSVFEFRIDGRPAVTARNHEMVAVTGLPLDRKIKVEVRLDGKPFETFRLELGKRPGNRVCLWLYEGYWHWIDNGWHAELGCRCGDEGGGVRE